MPVLVDAHQTSATTGADNPVPQRVLRPFLPERTVDHRRHGGTEIAYRPVGDDTHDLEAASYATNPALLQLEIAKANAEGLARACAGPQVTTCVIGGTTADIGMLRRP